MKNTINFIMCLLLLLMIADQAFAEKFQAKENEYTGWGIIEKTITHFSGFTLHWKTYPTYPLYEQVNLYPGDLIAEQSFMFINGRLLYTSLNSSTVHLSIIYKRGRIGYKFDQIELKNNETAIIGSLQPLNITNGSMLLIKMVHVKVNGEVTFQISQMGFHDLQYKNTK